jgi:hypothetical protein
MGGAAFLVGATSSGQADRSPIQYRITAQFTALGAQLSVRSVLHFPRVALSRTSEFRFTLPWLNERKQVSPQLRVEDAQGRPLTVTTAPDSTTFTVRLPNSSVPLVQIEYLVPFDPSSVEQLGYYLFLGSGSEVWYPVIEGLPDSIARFRDFDVSLSYPAGWSVITSGLEQSRDSSGGTIRSRFVAPHVEGFALAAGHQYRVETLEREGVRIVTFSPEGLLDKMRLIARETGEAVAWYRKAYHFFPVAQIGIVPGVTRSSGGFPMANLFMIHQGDLSAEFIRWITAHELGHYYWGLSTLDPEERLGWLVLGNGIWADHLYLAQRMGWTLEKTWRTGVQGNAFLDFAIAQVGNYEQRLGVRGPAEDSLHFDYNSYVRHGKGAVGIYLLAREIGPERFLAVQRDILRDYRYRVLPESAFAARLEQAGVRNPAGFLATWRKGDARVGYSVSRVQPDTAAGPFGQRVVVERTGTVAVPVDVAITASTGKTIRHRFTGGELDSTTVALDAPLARVSIDPDAALPMWDTGHEEMRRLYLRAFYEAGHADAFLDLAQPWLRDHRDPELAALVITRLFEVARYGSIAAMALGAEAPACDTRATCRAAILVARALGRCGNADRALALLEAIRPRVADFAATARWEAAREEVRHPGPPCGQQPDWID